MTTRGFFFLSVVLVPACFPANLAISSYFKDGVTPTSIASDAQGNILVAGSAVTDPASQTLGAVVAKLNPQASGYVYLTYLDRASSDQVKAIAVDRAGNAYVAGWTTNPNFPVVGGGALGTPPTSDADYRSFVAKLSPDGAVLFSVLIGGSTGSQAMGIALTPQGQILVSGIAVASGFPVTQGAYNVASSSGDWFLTKLDPAASTILFSATGIGGSSIALDATGNIYLAGSSLPGSSLGTNYPTTPGAYQTTFVQGHTCFGLCQIGLAGGLQHITKVDPSGSKLIYSTGLNDPMGLAGSTVNTGLAVDAAGAVFVTGTLLEASYPFTVPVTGNPSGYLSKLDPTGSTLLFSIPIGGGGVALDSSDALYVGGVVSSADPIGLTPSLSPVSPPAVLSWVPRQCWPEHRGV